MDLLALMMKLDDAVVDWLISTTAQTDAERKLARDVVAMRTRLDDSIRELVLNRLKLAMVPLERETAKLNELNDAMGKTEKSIADGQKVVRTLADGLAVAAQALAMIAVF